MDGNQFIAELSRKKKNLPPIVALSYHLQDILPNPAISIQAIKPMTTEKLRETVILALGSSNQVNLPKAS